MTPSIRKAIVSGRFYPSDPKEIHELMAELLKKEKPRIDYSLADNKILGAIIPHAGHIYSGYQTLHFFEILKFSKQVFDTFIIIHPLHQAGGAGFAVEGSTQWNTPLGNVNIDLEFIESMGLPVSSEIHKYEHSSEVIVPFIQNYFGNDFLLVSIGMSSQNPYNAKEISNAIIKAKKDSSKKICLIASSDFSHYVKPQVGRIMDQKVIDCILRRDIDGIYREVSENDLSICGFGPIMAVSFALLELNPEYKPVILSRGHSGEVIPSDEVVDYISIMYIE